MEHYSQIKIVVGLGQVLIALNINVCMILPWESYLVLSFYIVSAYDYCDPSEVSFVFSFHQLFIFLYPILASWHVHIDHLKVQVHLFKYLLTWQTNMCNDGLEMKGINIAEQKLYIGLLFIFFNGPHGPLLPFPKCTILWLLPIKRVRAFVPAPCLIRFRSEFRLKFSLRLWLKENYG